MLIRNVQFAPFFYKILHFCPCNPNCNQASMPSGLGPVQTPLHSCAEPNWWIKYSKRAASESTWYGSLVWCGKRVKFDRVCRTFIELNLGSTHGTLSESNVAPVSLQSRTYSVRFGTWKVQRLNQALLAWLITLGKNEYRFLIIRCSMLWEPKSGHNIWTLILQ